MDNQALPRSKWLQPGVPKKRGTFFVARWKCGHARHIARGTAGGDSPSSRRRGTHNVRVFGAVAGAQLLQNTGMEPKCQQSESSGPPRFTNSMKR